MQYHGQAREDGAYWVCQDCDPTVQGMLSGAPPGKMPGAKAAPGPSSRAPTKELLHFLADTPPAPSTKPPSPTEGESKRRNTRTTHPPQPTGDLAGSAGHSRSDRSKL